MRHLWLSMFLAAIFVTGAATAGSNQLAGLPAPERLAALQLALQGYDSACNTTQQPTGCKSDVGRHMREVFAEDAAALVGKATPADTHRAHTIGTELAAEALASK